MIFIFVQLWHDQMGPRNQKCILFNYHSELLGLKDPEQALQFRVGALLQPQQAEAVQEAPPVLGVGRLLVHVVVNQLQQVDDGRLDLRAVLPEQQGQQYWQQGLFCWLHQLLLGGQGLLVVLVDGADQVQGFLDFGAKARLLVEVVDCLGCLFVNLSVGGLYPEVLEKKTLQIGRRVVYDLPLEDIVQMLILGMLEMLMPCDSINNVGLYHRLLVLVHDCNILLPPFGVLVKVVVVDIVHELIEYLTEDVNLFLNLALESPHLLVVTAVPRVRVVQVQLIVEVLIRQVGTPVLRQVAQRVLTHRLLYAAAQDHEIGAVPAAQVLFHALLLGLKQLEEFGLLLLNLFLYLKIERPHLGALDRLPFEIDERGEFLQSLWQGALGLLNFGLATSEKIDQKHPYSLRFYYKRFFYWYTQIILITLFVHPTQRLNLLSI